MSRRRAPREVVLALVVLLLLAHSASATHYHPIDPPLPLWPGADLDAALARLSRALQFRTVSVPPADAADAPPPATIPLEDPAQMRALHEHLAKSYPSIFGAEGVHPTTTVERLGCGNLSLLITVRGADPALRNPILLVSHLDVVPALDAAAWTHPPFSGAVADGYVWGRGAVDVKGPAIALLEALESLLRARKEPWRPLRTVMVALGHDEEVGGACGAARVAERLAQQQRGGFQLHALWDEGAGVMLDGVPSLVSRPTALIGTAEKRAVRVVARARAPGGHASMPPIQNGGAASKSRSGRSSSKSMGDTGLTVGALLGRLLAAVDASPPRAQLRRPTSDMLLAAAPQADKPLLRAAVAAAARFRPLQPLLARAMSRASAGGNALVRTTVVATQIHAGGGGGGGENVMPQSGEVVWNVRLLPGWGGARELRRYFAARLREALPEAWHRAQVEVVVEGGIGGEGGEEEEEEAAAVAPAQGPVFDALKGAIERCWSFEHREETATTTTTISPPLVLPALLVGMTDSRNFRHLVAREEDGGGGILRFLPLSLSRATLGRIHGTDERVSVGDFARAMCTYSAGIEALGALGAVEAEGGGGGGGAAAAAASSATGRRSEGGGGGGGGGGGEL
jgi:carboxypeptidase PM20D1